MPDLDYGGARQLLCHQLLHELRRPGVHAGSALVQAHHPRPPQQHPRQAQQLLLPCAFTPPPSAPLLQPYQLSANHMQQPQQGCALLRHGLHCSYADGKCHMKASCCLSCTPSDFNTVLLSCALSFCPAVSFVHEHGWLHADGVKHDM